MKITLPNEFWFSVSVEPDGCWRWDGVQAARGYGHYNRSYRSRPTRLVHRLAYMALVGPIPDDLPLDHLCRNRACCNPEHLEPVTLGVNVLRGETLAARNTAATACIHGHEFTAMNTYVTPNGRRNCRRCRADASARAYRRKVG